MGSDLTRPTERPAGTPLREALFAPRSIALVGASDDPTKSAARPLQYLRRIGYPGRIYPVNPRRGVVLGEPAWPSLEALPECPDQAYILTQTEAAIDAAAECGRLGIPVATLLADGFTAMSSAGSARIARLQDICAQSGLRVVGPSCLGVVDLRHRLLLTANAAFAEPDLPVGRIFVASHSGSLIGALVSRGKARGVGFASLVSAGNEIDLSIGEICAATLDDPGIDGYLLFLETLRHANALHDFARRAIASGRPVVAYKLGRSAPARELTVTHTGALAGEDDVADAFLADCGIARVDVFEALIESLPLLARLPLAGARSRAPTVGIVTTTGGGAAMVVDQLALRGVTVARPAPATFERLATVGVEIEPARIVDLTLAGTRYAVMKAALDTLLTAPEFDLIIAVVGSSARFHPELAVRPLIDCASSAKPLAAFLAPEAPDALTRLMEAGVPSFRTPEACAEAVAAGFGRRMPTKTILPAVPSPVATRTLDELESYQVLDRIGISRPTVVVVDADLTTPPALPFAFPVAAKLLCAGIAHKTEIGGVKLDIGDATALMQVIGDLRATVSLRRPDLSVERVLVQPMVSGVGEALVGYRVDPQVGPLIVLAVGGVLAELFDDRAIRLAPVDLTSAAAMIDQVKGLRRLAGYRETRAGDLPALARAIVALSELALHDRAISEAEINPLIVRHEGEGVMAVDAVVRLR